jgi:hypothetical protein
MQMAASVYDLVHSYFYIHCASSFECSILQYDLDEAHNKHVGRVYDSHAVSDHASVDAVLQRIAFLTTSETSGDVQEETETELWGEFFSQFQGDEDQSSKVEPVSDFNYPILDDTLHVRSVEGVNSSALGIVSATIFWRTMLRYVTAAVVMMCSKLELRSSPHTVPTTDLTQEYSLRRFHWYSYCL